MIDLRLSAWMDRAACIGQGDLFVPDGTTTAMKARAAAICAGCPVAVECAAYAVDVEADWGMWAGAWRGLTDGSRPFRYDVEHGSERGYQQHRRRTDPACDPCKSAHNVHANRKRVAA